MTIPQILDTLDHLGPRPGITNLTKILATGHAPTRSELEDAVLDLLLNAGFKPPHVNVPINLDGRTIDPRLPLARPTPGHRGRRQPNGTTTASPAKTTPRKQAILEAAGERVIRITWAQAITQRAQTLARIKAAGAPG